MGTKRTGRNARNRQEGKTVCHRQTPGSREFAILPGIGSSLSIGNVFHDIVARLAARWENVNALNDALRPKTAFSFRPIESIFRI